jgi:DNA-binding transcriptional MocR family regulator
VTAAPVVGQAWRGSARQAHLARLLAMIDVRSTHLGDARAAGELLASSGTADVVDALLALLAVPGDHLLTSDPADLHALIEERGIPVLAVRLDEPSSRMVLRCLTESTPTADRTATN